MKKLLASSVLILALILLFALGCAAAESGGAVTVDAAFIGNTTEDVQLRVHRI